MEGGVGDGGSRQPHRLHQDLGRQHPGPAHLDGDVQHLCQLLLRRILVGDSPPGAFGGAAYESPLGQIIDLHYRPVHVKGQLLPALPQPDNFLIDRLSVLQQLPGNDLEALVLQVVQRLSVGGEGSSFRQL